MTEDEMAGWHHRLNGHEFEQAPEVGGGQGGCLYILEISPEYSLEGLMLKLKLR